MGVAPIHDPRQLSHMPIRDPLPALLLILLVALLFLSTIVHALSYFGYDPRQVSVTLWYALQLSSALAFIPAFIVVYFRRQDRKPPQPLLSLDKVLGLCFVIFILYGIFNYFFTSIVLNQDASPEIVNGQYSLVRHGAVLMTLTKAQFVKHQVYEARTGAGHWMAFYLFAISALRSSRRNERHANAETP